LGNWRFIYVPVASEAFWLRIVGLNNFWKCDLGSIT